MNSNKTTLELGCELGALDTVTIICRRLQKWPGVYLYLEGPSTSHVRILVPNIISGIVYGAKVLK